MILAYATAVKNPVGFLGGNLGFTCFMEIVENQYLFRKKTAQKAYFYCTELKSWVFNYCKSRHKGFWTELAKNNVSPVAGGGTPKLVPRTTPKKRTINPGLDHICIFRVRIEGPQKEESALGSP